MRSLILLWLACSGVWSQCLPIQAERIFAEDLAKAVPAFAEARGQWVALSPLAGAERRFLKAELVRLARRLGLGEGAIRSAEWPESVCFAYPESPLDQTRLELALANAAGGPVEADVIDFSRFPVPPGPIEFARGGLTSDRADGARLLRGSVLYAPGRKQPIWVRIRPRIQRHVLVTLRELQPGEVVDAGAVRSEPTTLQGGPALSSLSEIEGLSARRAIPAGTRITRSLFVRARDVDPGQTVKVQVSSGAARLNFEARAETGGFSGDQILIRSPLSDQRVKVRVAGRGRAEIEVSSPIEKEQ